MDAPILISQQSLIAYCVGQGQTPGHPGAWGKVPLRTGISFHTVSPIVDIRINGQHGVVELSPSSVDAGRTANGGLRVGSELDSSGVPDVYVQAFFEFANESATRTTFGYFDTGSFALTIKTADNRTKTWTIYVLLLPYDWPYVSPTYYRYMVGTRQISDSIGFMIGPASLHWQEVGPNPGDGGQLLSITPSKYASGLTIKTERPEGSPTNTKVNIQGVAERPGLYRLDMRLISAVTEGSITNPFAGGDGEAIICVNIYDQYQPGDLVLVGPTCTEPDYISDVRVTSAPGTFSTAHNMLGWSEFITRGVFKRYNVANAGGYPEHWGVVVEERSGNNLINSWYYRIELPPNALGNWEIYGFLFEGSTPRSASALAQYTLAQVQALVPTSDQDLLSKSPTLGLRDAQPPRGGWSDSLILVGESEWYVPEGESAGWYDYVGISNNPLYSEDVDVYQCIKHIVPKYAGWTIYGDPVGNPGKFLVDINNTWYISGTPSLSEPLTIISPPQPALRRGAVPYAPCKIDDLALTTLDALFGESEENPISLLPAPQSIMKIRPGATIGSDINVGDLSVVINKLDQEEGNAVPVWAYYPLRRLLEFKLLDAKVKVTAKYKYSEQSSSTEGSDIRIEGTATVAAVKQAPNQTLQLGHSSTSLTSSQSLDYSLEGEKTYPLLYAVFSNFEIIDELCNLIPSSTAGVIGNIKVSQSYNSTQDTDYKWYKVYTKFPEVPTTGGGEWRLLSGTLNNALVDDPTAAPSELTNVDEKVWLSAVGRPERGSLTFTGTSGRFEVYVYGADGWTPYPDPDTGQPMGGPLDRYQLDIWTDSTDPHATISNDQLSIGYTVVRAYISEEITNSVQLPANPTDGTVVTCTAGDLTVSVIYRAGGTPGPTPTPTEEVFVAKEQKAKTTYTESGLSGNSSQVTDKSLKSRARAFLGDGRESNCAGRGLVLSGTAAVSCNGSVGPTPAQTITGTASETSTYQHYRERPDPSTKWSYVDGRGYQAAAPDGSKMTDSKWDQDYNIPHEAPTIVLGRQAVNTNAGFSSEFKFILLSELFGSGKLQTSGVNEIVDVTASGAYSYETSNSGGTSQYSGADHSATKHTVTGEKPSYTYDGEPVNTDYTGTVQNIPSPPSGNLIRASTGKYKRAITIRYTFDLILDAKFNTESQI